MCGIFGFCTFGGRYVQAELLRQSTRMLRHRGPDAEGLVGWDGEQAQYVNEMPDSLPLTMGLGHRRLAILDLSDAGSQPMRGEGGEWIVHNGEVYNFVELRDELEGHGFSFSTGTDTEVILRAYEKWGEDCVNHFNGMWAFTIYDAVRNGFFSSRDRMGIKPFYYFRSKDVYCFSSEVQSIFACINEDPIIDPQQLARYLVSRGIDDGRSTIYRNIEELRGGFNSWLDVKTGGFKVWRFWHLPEEADLDLSDAEALGTFSELFEDSVRIRLRADVPVAVTLSGGIDSSSVAVAAGKVEGQEIRTFTSRFPENPEIDETAYAKQVIATCGAKATFVEPDLNRLLEEEPLLARHQAMPYTSLSLYVHWAILSCIREYGVPVVLAGQGGDELFMGYERYYVSHLASLLPNLPKAIVAAVQGGVRSRLGMLGMVEFVLYFGFPSLRGWRLKRRANMTFKKELLRHNVFGENVMHVKGLRRLQEEELLRGSLSRLLRYDDRTSGAHSMETRLPFLDYRIVEFAYRLPWRHKIRNGWTKYLLRQYLDQNGLPSVAWRRHKLGFDAPSVAWTRQLVRHRGAALCDHPIAGQLLRDGVSLSQLPPEQQWNAYNILHLATLLGWKNLYDGSSC